MLNQVNILCCLSLVNIVGSFLMPVYVVIDRTASIVMGNKIDFTYDVLCKKMEMHDMAENCGMTTPNMCTA